MDYQGCLDTPAIEQRGCYEDALKRKLEKFRRWGQASVAGHPVQLRSCRNGSCFP
jgi:hypothetical protein